MSVLTEAGAASALSFAPLPFCPLKAKMKNRDPEIQSLGILSFSFLVNGKRVAARHSLT